MEKNVNLEQATPVAETPVQVTGRNPLTDEQAFAVDVLIQAADIAQAKGAFTLRDAGFINDAVNLLAEYRIVREEKQEVTDDETVAKPKRKKK